MPAKFKVHILIASLALGTMSSLAAYGQAAASAPAKAPVNAGPAPTKIGLVNVQEAIQTTNEGQKELDDLVKRFAPKQTELRSLSDEIDRLKKQLETQGSKISDDERNNQVRAIELKQKTLQRSYEDAQAEFQQAQQDIGARIYQKMAGVLEQYASSKGFAVVLDVSGQQSAVLWGNQGTVITQDLVAAYNAQSPVPPRAPAAGAQAPPSGAATPKKP